MSIGKKRILVYLVMVTSLFLAINLMKDITALKKADRRLNAAEAELNQAKQEREGLKRGLAKAADSFWRESQIRNVLKMAKPEEVVVVVPEEVTTQAEQAGKAVKVEEEESNLDRWRQVFGF